MDTFSTRLRTLRKAAGYSQERLAKIAGISLTSVNLYESGEREPGAYAIKQLADALHTSADYLLDTLYNKEGDKCAQVR